MSSDQSLTRPDREVSTNVDTGSKILLEQSKSDFASIGNRSQLTAKSAAMVATAEIPPLQIVGLDSTAVDGTTSPQESNDNPVAEFFHDAGTVVADISTGAFNEVTQRPLEVLEAGATGLGIGLGIAAVAFFAPEAAVVAGAMALGYGIGELVEHIPGWMHDAGVVSNAEEFSAAEVAQAHSNLQDVGKGTTLIVAGAAGGLASGFVASAAESAITDMALSNSALPKPNMTGLIDDVTQSATTADAPAAVVADVAQSATTADAPAAIAADAPAAIVADAKAPSTLTAEGAAKVEVAEVAEPVAAVPMTVEQSVNINKGIFQASPDEVVPSVKQLYQVKFEKVGPGGQVLQTLENRAGVEVPEGQWIATRLNADGTPNIEDGIVNSWTPKEAAILKTYQLTAEQLAENPNLIGWTRTDAPPVHMVQLKEPIDIQTSWGSMHGDAGSWLANYDYNPVTGEPGSSYAIVTAKSYADTYKPV